MKKVRPRELTFFCLGMFVMFLFFEFSPYSPLNTLREAYHLLLESNPNK